MQIALGKEPSWLCRCIYETRKLFSALPNHSSWWCNSQSWSRQKKRPIWDQNFFSWLIQYKSMSLQTSVRGSGRLSFIITEEIEKTRAGVCSPCCFFFFARKNWHSHRSFQQELYETRCFRERLFVPWSAHFSKQFYQNRFCHCRETAELLFTLPTQQGCSNKLILWKKNPFPSAKEDWGKAYQRDLVIISASGLQCRGLTSVLIRLSIWISVQV